MSVAPEPILRAGNETVSWACIFCRNQTLQDGAPTKIRDQIRCSWPTGCRETTKMKGL